jgi:predicted metal-dependent HD superfamily phosphohydrolase
MDLAKRWDESWELAGMAPPPGAFERVCARYREPHRAYHNLDHVAACLALAAETRPMQRAPGEVELAIWYHDAVYDARRADNEEASARLAVAELGILLPAALAKVRDHILATRHPSNPADPDSRVMVDIDLAILAAEPAAFDAYERAVRSEYSWVPGFLFRRNRARFLRELLAAEHVFLTEHFRARFEERARANVRRSLGER